MQPAADTQKSDHKPMGAVASQSGKGGVELSVIIVSYSVKEFLEQTLVSVRRALKGTNAEVIVVDNASRDGSVTLVRQRFPEVTLVANDTNLGFAKASNQGLRLAQGQFIVLLNPDTIVQEDTFSTLIKYFGECPDTGMLGCKILNPDGTLQLACRRSYPTPWVALTKMIGLGRLFPKSKLFGRYNLTYLDPEQSYEVEAISGSFMMIRREVLEAVGPLDESFFMYGEDLDWCYRIREHGWKVRYFPGTQIVHFKGESSKSAQFDSIRQFYQAMALFAKKHFKHKYILMPYWVLLVAIWLRAGLTFIKKIFAGLVFPLTDFIFLSISMILAVYVRFDSIGHLTSFIPAQAVYAVVWISSLALWGCYHRKRFSALRTMSAILVGFFFNASFTFFFKQYAYSRAVVLLAGLSNMVLIPGWRLLLKLLLHKSLVPFKRSLSRTLFNRKAVIVGDFDSGEELVEKFNSDKDSRYDIAGLISTNGKDAGQVYNGMPVLGALDDLNHIIQDEKIQEVIFSTRRLSYDRILGIIARSGDLNVNFKLIPSHLEVIIGKASIDRMDDVPLLEIDYKLHQNYYRSLKRVFDILLAFVVAIVALPLFVMKKLSGHKLQKRRLIGYQKNLITLHEFDRQPSTMFDKIPYLWSVLKGDLSFVGREIVNADDTLELGQPALFELKPGITGLVQINRRRNLSQEDKEKYDLFYLKNYSPVLDVEILLRSVLKR